MSVDFTVFFFLCSRIIIDQNVLGLWKLVDVILYVAFEFLKVLRALFPNRFSG